MIFRRDHTVLIFLSVCLFVVQTVAVSGEDIIVGGVVGEAAPGPGIVDGETPLYNDMQCGRGPPAAIADELTCPGRVDIGTISGCRQFGPRWDLENADASKASDRVLPRPAETHPDIVTVIDIIGMRNPGALNWSDSYSVGDKCYCATSFDHGIDVYMVETPSMGYMSVKDVCDLLGPGPGIEEGVTPIYNDIQCGNCPPNNALDEQRCPGRVKMSWASRHRSRGLRSHWSEVEL